MPPTKRIYYGWVVVAVSNATIAIYYGIWYSFAVFFVAILEEFHASRASTALAFSIGNLVMAAAAPIVGHGVRRLGLRMIMPIGGAVAVAGLLLSSTVTSVPQLYIFYGVIVGIGIASNGFVPHTAIMSNWFIRKRGTAIGLAYAGLGLGMLAFVPLAQSLILALGWRWAFRAEAAAILLLAMPLVAFFQKLTPQEMGLEPDGPDGGTGGSGHPKMLPRRDYAFAKVQEIQPAWTLRTAMKSRSFWYVLLLTTFGAMAIQGVMFHQAAFAVDAGYDKIIAAAVLGYLGLFRSVGQISCGYVSDRIWREWAYTVAVVMIILGVISLRASSAGNSIYLYAFAALFGLGSGAISPLFPSISADLFHGKNFAPIFGFHSMGFSVGSAAGPWIAGYLFDNFGDYTLAFNLVFLFLMISLASGWAAAPRRSRQGLKIAPSDA